MDFVMRTLLRAKPQDPGVTLGGQSMKPPLTSTGISGGEACEFVFMFLGDLGLLPHMGVQSILYECRSGTRLQVLGITTRGLCAHTPRADVPC